MYCSSWLDALEIVKDVIAAVEVQEPEKPPPQELTRTVVGRDRSLETKKEESETETKPKRTRRRIGRKPRKASPASPESSEGALHACDIDGCDFSAPSEGGLRIHQLREHGD